MSEQLRDESRPDRDRDEVEELLKKRGVKRVPPELRTPPGQTQVTLVSKLLGGPPRRYPSPNVRPSR